MAAHNPALTQLLAALNVAPHAGMGNDFFAHVGSSLALARSVPPEWFPRSTTRLCMSYTECTVRLC